MFGLFFLTRTCRVSAALALPSPQQFQLSAFMASGEPTPQDLPISHVLLDAYVPSHFCLNVIQCYNLGANDVTSSYLFPGLN